MALPKAPQDLTVVETRPSDARLHWTYPFADELRFYLERKVGAGAWLNEATLQANRTTHVAPELVPGTPYSFRLRASNAEGQGPYSNTVTATPPIPPRIVAPADLTYLGQMKVPEGVSAFGGGAMTGRTVNGQVSFFLCGHAYQGGAVYEFPYVGHHRDVLQAPRAVATTLWGDVYQGRKISWDRTGKPRGPLTTNSPWQTQSLLYRDGDLWWTYADPYNGESVNDACLGVTTLTASPATQTALGPWRVDPANGANSQQCSRMVLGLPDGRLALGGGHTSIAAAAAWGPTLRAFTAPSGAGGQLAPLLPSALQVYHDLAPYGQGQLDKGVIQPGARVHRKSRTPNYRANLIGDPGGPDIEPTLNGGKGYFTQIDDVNGGIWLDLPDRHGLLLFGSLGTGLVGYGSGGSASRGENADGFEPVWWIYDPAELAKVERGELEPHAVQPTHTFDPRTLTDAASIRTDAKFHFGGAYLDPASRRLFMCAPSADPTYPTQPLPLIHVFQVAG